MESLTMSLRLIYEYLALAVEVVLQKLWLRHVPPLELVGGPADGLVCIVTGPTSGIGTQVAAELARRGAHVILACRSAERGEALRASLAAAAAAAGAPPPRAEVMPLDLNSLASVRAFAAAFRARGLPLGALVNNAGIFSMGAARAETADGFEAHLGTNHLAHFLLALLLLPALRAGSAALGRPARVVSVSSRLCRMCVSLDRRDPHFRRRRYASAAAYAQSKAAQVLFSAELTRRARGAVLAVAVHPGEVLTDVVRSLPAPVRAAYVAFVRVVLLTPAQGARPAVHAATDGGVGRAAAAAAAAGRAPPAYHDSDCAPGWPGAVASDPGAAAWLWGWSAAEVGLAPEDDLPPPPAK